MGMDTQYLPLDPQVVKEKAIAYVRAQGADLVGFAPVSRWDEAGEVPPEFRPQSLWPLAQTVIVIGMQMPLPIVDTTPSALHMELYNTANRELDGLAFNLTRLLNRMGCAAFFFPRDGYGSIKILKETPMAAFGHVPAAKYAGLGTIGVSHNLLTPEFGPRVRLVSVFTAPPLPPDPMRDKELCIRCHTCVKACPAGALKAEKGDWLAQYDKLKCAERAEELTRRRCYPCGTCTKVCPVGEDRRLYQEKGFTKRYLEEQKALELNPQDQKYAGWVHTRKYGSWPEGRP